MASGHDLHHDALLSQIAINYRPKGFIADLVFPTVGVGKQSDAYPIWNQNDWYRVDNANRTRGREANVIDISVTSAKYYCENYALKAKTFAEDLANTDLGWGVSLGSKAEFITSKLLLAWERRIAGMVNSTTNVGTTSVVDSAWETGGDPIKNITNALEAFKACNGIPANKIVFGDEAWDACRKNSNVRGVLYTHAAGAQATEANLAAFLGVDKILVGRAYYSTTDEGQTATMANAWTKDNFLVYYAPDVPSLIEPSFGYTFRWTPESIPVMAAEIHPYDSKTKSQEVEIGHYLDEVITASALGHLWTGINSSASGGIL